MFANQQGTNTKGVELYFTSTILSFSAINMLKVYFYQLLKLFNLNDIFKPIFPFNLFQRFLRSQSRVITLRLPWHANASNGIQLGSEQSHCWALARPQSTKQVNNCYPSSLNPWSIKRMVVFSILWMFLFFRKRMLKSRVAIIFSCEMKTFFPAELRPRLSYRRVTWRFIEIWSTILVGN